MKKWISLVLLALMCLGSLQHVYAVTPKSVMNAELAVPTMLETEMATESSSLYELPFPGILPNNPLYFLKQIRDTILESLISDQVKKGDFYRLQADKFLAMAILAKQEKNIALFLQTAQLSVQSSQKATTVYKNLASSGQSVPSAGTDRLLQSQTYRYQVLSGNAEDIQGAEKEEVHTLSTQVQRQIADLAIFRKE